MNLVFAAVILAAAAVLLLVRKANQTGAPLCAELIYGDSNTRLTFPLEKDADYDVDTGYLTVHIRIQDGAARFVDSPCPDHICESFGWLSEEDQTATCLPARAVLSIINNSDCKILLDQRKYMNKFDQIQALLGLTEKEKGQILSINMANNPSRLYKEVWIGLGGTQSAVYATEVSAEEYLAYTTEETEKVEVYRLAEKLGDDIEAAIRQLAERRRNKE